MSCACPTAYDNTNGLSLTMADAVDYFSFMKETATLYGLKVGLKNSVRHQCECGLGYSDQSRHGAHLLHHTLAGKQQMCTVVVVTSPCALLLILVACHSTKVTQILPCTHAESVTPLLLVLRLQMAMLNQTSKGKKISELADFCVNER
jgi:hypothetical protein